MGKHWDAFVRNMPPVPTSLLACSFLPANDRPVDVKIEIRAAELAGMGREMFFKAEVQELNGFFDNAMDCDRFSAWDLDAWLAGWLAYEIVTNKEDK